MNDYIINPSFFYWVNVVDGLSCFVLILAIAGSIAFSICIFVHWVDYDKISKWAIKGLICSVCLAMFFVFIPNKKTMIEMEIARHTTKSNVRELREDVKDVADYVFKKIEEMDK